MKPGPEEQQTPDPPPPSEPAFDPMEQLKELGELRRQGILTEEEFTAEKKKLAGLRAEAERRHDLDCSVRERRGADPDHEQERLVPEVAGRPEREQDLHDA